MLAAPPRDPETELATYTDVHVRGLTVSVADRSSVTAVSCDDEPVVAEALQLLVSVTPGMAMPDGAAWYALYTGDPE